jgi:hypothetical protein
MFLALFNDAVSNTHIIKHDMKIIMKGRFQMMRQEEVVVYVTLSRYIPCVTRKILDVTTEVDGLPEQKP